jgi:hypothetical protein
MTAPFPGAIRLPLNKFLTPIVESLDGYKEAINDAEQIAAHLRGLPPIPRVPPAPGPVTFEWQITEDERDADAERVTKWRNRALSRQRARIAEHRSILTANVDHILRLLNLHLLDVVLKAAPDAEVLIAAGVDNADQAIEQGLVPEWSRLQRESWTDYDTLRGSQEFLHIHVAPQRIWMSARPSLDGEDPASTLWFKNMPQLWPDWRERGRTRQQFTIQGSSPRPEPWPRPDGAEFLIWSFKAKAEHWIPDTKQFDEAFGPQRRPVADDDDDPQQRDDESVYDSLLFGPLEAERKRQAQAQERSTSFKSYPPPILA